MYEKRNERIGKCLARCGRRDLHQIFIKICKWVSHGSQHGTNASTNTLFVFWTVVPLNTYRDLTPTKFWRCGGGHSSLSAHMYGVDRGARGGGGGGDGGRRASAGRTGPHSCRSLAWTCWKCLFRLFAHFSLNNVYVEGSSIMILKDR